MAEEKCRGCGEWVTHTEWLGFCRPCAEKRGMVPEARRCKICQWWECEPIEDRPKDGGRYTCGHDLLNVRPDGVHPFPANSLWGDDGGGSPVTGPEFGCIHWEARTPDAQTQA